MVKRLNVSEPHLVGNEERYVLDCVRTRSLSQGGYVEAFEQAFALQCGVRHAVACMNGTVALHLALLALGVGPGDEVLVPALTYIATANAVAYTGATPVLCDVEPSSWCIDPLEIVKRRTKRTKGIIPVHLYGHAAEMNQINALAAHYKLFVLEDAAEAHGGSYYGRPVGSLGTAATFSFYGNKILTCGEGGMVVTNSQNMVDRMRLYRGQGMSPTQRYYHPVLGYNYRMTNLQGALGLAQLETIQTQLARRRIVCEQYRRGLRDLRLQSVQLGTTHANWMFAALLPAHICRDAAMARLNELNIETRPTFVGLHAMPMYHTEERFPVTDMISARGINLPTHAGLDPDDVARVCAAVMDICN